VVGEPRLKSMLADCGRALVSIAACAAAFAIMLLLSPSPGAAQATMGGPFANLSGSWAGSGAITLSSGTKERIRCKADYSLLGRANVQVQLTCASDSYKFELRANVAATEHTLSGTWDEVTRRVSGQIVGRISGDKIDARAEGQTFTALLKMTTRGNRQSVFIESPGSEMAGITITLNRRSK